MAIITIIGAGMMGSALAFPAAENGNTVRLVGTHLDNEIIDFASQSGRHPKFEIPFPKNVSYYHIDEVEEALVGAQIVIGGVSSFGVEWFSSYVLPLIPDGVHILTVTKGLLDTEDGRLLTYPEIWKKRLSDLSKQVTLSAIGGPCTSYELVAHDQTEVTFCSESKEALAILKAALATDYYHVSTTNDVIGIESAVALKNGYALGIALTIGLNHKFFGNDQLHFNSQAAVFAQATREMYRLLEYQGALTLNNLSVGVGDLYVTVYGGRTRLVGILLGEGLSISEAKERLNGVTLESLVVSERVARAVRLAISEGVLRAEDFPLLLHIDDILTGGASVSLPWEDFTYSE